MSAFAIEDGIVYHTYSTYARGLDGLWGIYQWLDRAPKGRNSGGVHRQVQKIFQSESSRSVSENKREIRWQQVGRET
jgi:predicted dithiol-disulfide oxidoreductase (DUF899 family)